MDNNWIDAAPCRGSTKVFYPVGDRQRQGRPRVDVDIWAPARAVCATCPHIDACRDFVQAYEHGEVRYGYAAGMTPDERYLAARDQPSTRYTASPIPHGTNYGHKLHVLRDEPICQACAQAKAAYMAAYKVRRRGAA